MVTRLPPITLGAYKPKKEKKLFGIFKPTKQAKFVSKVVRGKATKKEIKAEVGKFAKGLVISGTIASVVYGGVAIAGAKAVAGRVVAGTVAKTVARKVAVKTALTTAGKTVLKGAGKVGLTAVKVAIKKPALAIVGAGVLVSGAGPKIVKTLFQAGKVGGEVITGEKALTSETVTDVLKGAGVVLGLGAVGTVAGIVAKKVLEKKEQIPAIPQETEGLVAGDVGTPITPTPPITPETVSLEEPAVVTPEKKPSEARREKITQRVNVIVRQNNRILSPSVKYLNPVCY